MDTNNKVYKEDKKLSSNDNRHSRERGRSNSPDNGPAASKFRHSQHNRTTKSRTDRGGGKSPKRSTRTGKENNRRRSPSQEEDRENNNTTDSQISDGEETNSRNKKSDKEQQKKEKNRNDNRTQKERKNSNSNKTYKTPPTPPPDWLRWREHCFVLDSVAVDNLEHEYGPKLGQVIPPYNSTNDRAVRSYFRIRQVQKTLKRNGQIPGEAIEGAAVERFFQSGPGYKYLTPRNRHGAGHSADTINGHGCFVAN